MISEKELSDLNGAKQANYLLGLLKPILLEQREEVILKMKATYQEGTQTESKLLAMVAEIATLDGIQDRLKSKIIRGEYASRKIEHAKRNDD